MQEFQHTEFKRQWKDELLKWVCGFANAEGSALMVGYHDQGKPIGAINAETLLAANAFFRAGLIEPRGRGIERITQACEEEGYPRPL